VADLFKQYCKNTKIELNSSYLINKLNLKTNNELKLTVIMSNKTKEYENKLLKLLNF